MMTFGKFNETVNYYSKTSRTTAQNVWNQDEIQRQFTELVANCNLTKEQIEMLNCFMVSNNATIDMKPTKNNSANEFNVFIKSNEDVIEKSMSA